MPRSKPASTKDLRSLPTLADVVAGTALNRRIRSRDEAVALSVLYTRKRMDTVAQHFFAGREVTEAEFAALMVLYDYRRTPLKQADLARLLLVTRLSAREVVLRLERKQLVEGAPHEDKRARALRVTAKGAATLRAVRDAYDRMLRRALAGMSDRERDALLEGCHALRRSMREGLDDAPA